MNKHPTKLIVMVPIYTVKNSRRILSAIDDAVVVHHHADGRFDLGHRPMVILTPTGITSYAAALAHLADDLQRSHRIVMVDRDDVVANLVQQARDHATDQDRGAIEQAAQLIAERTTFQLFDHMFKGTSEYEISRQLIGMRERRTKPDRHEQPGLNLQCGVVTPRAEQLWHVLRHEWCSPRLEQEGRLSWEAWCRRNRPSLPEARP